MKYVRLMFLCVPTLTLASWATAVTIHVDFGNHATVEEASSCEDTVGWDDANPGDDIACTHSFAAAELQRYLGKMTGDPAAFAASDDANVARGDLILVGKPETNTITQMLMPAFPPELPARLTQLGPEDFVVAQTVEAGRRVVLIAGGGRLGTLYGAYAYLEALGVRWYAPGPQHEEVPTCPYENLFTISLQESPSFQTRGFHAWEDRGDPDFLLWMARNRLNYWCVEQKEKGLLHKLGIQLVGGAHILTPYYLDPPLPYPYNHPQFPGDDAKPADPYPVSPTYQGDVNQDGVLSYFEAHPEWYGLHDGKRSDQIKDDAGDNFCTSNAEAMGEWCKNAVEDLISGRYKDATIMNAWALDGGRWCECDACKAQGSATDRNVFLVYCYDKAIKAAQADKRIQRTIRLLFLAYYDVIEPPTKPLPADFDYNTCIATYFPIGRNYVYAIDDERSSKNAEYLRNLTGWAIAPERNYRGQICIGEYYNVSGYKCLPICFMNTMAHDIPYYYKEMGARHFHYMHCTTKNWGNKALTNWQMARQLWNVNVDTAALWTDYFNGRYGVAAPSMRTFYETLEKMLSNVTELKYGLSGRLNEGADELFPNNSLKYAPATFAVDDGPDLQEIVQFANECRALLDGVRATALPERVAFRVAEDERLFTYGERTVRFYDALCRAFMRAREGKKDEGRAALTEAEALAAQLLADTESTQYASSHANDPNALEASRAKGALPILHKLLD